VVVAFPLLKGPPCQDSHVSNPAGGQLIGPFEPLNRR
jgi:hypothetical protein